MRHGSENISSFNLRVKMLISPQYKLKLDIGEYIAFEFNFSLISNQNGWY